MIKFENVYKKFDNIIAIQGATFEIEKGHTVGLIGANGSGKSTVLRMMATIYDPTSGNIVVDEMNTKTDKQKIRRRIGLLLGGNASLYEALSAYENLYYQACLQNIPKEEIDRVIVDVANRFQLKSFLTRRVSGFSRGMRQRVAFSKAILHDPEILLLDEPSTGLDIDAISEIHSFIMEQKLQKKTVVLSSHNSEEIDTLCDDVIFIKGGKIVEFGNKDKLKAKVGATSITELYKVFCGGLL